MEYKIYKITNIITNKLYIGKTTQSLLERLADHIQEAKR
jgi:predicted GIY-YIG superfamily endonuclease